MLSVMFGIYNILSLPLEFTINTGKALEHICKVVKCSVNLDLG